MQKELSYYRVGDDYGWDQDKFPGFLMKHAGCAAVTACDSCIYLKLYKGLSELCPYVSADITREEYLDFAGEMKPYLYPRMGGIDTLNLYMDSFGNYLHDRGSSLEMTPFAGTESLQEAEQVIVEQLDQEIPIPYLMLKHKKKELDDYTWHWFMLTGYKTEAEDRNDFQVKVVTYGEAVWFDLAELWDTGYEQKGGMILFHLESRA
ncbi:MAG: hypothetical protein LUH07_01085 [Lachnospiraceae bacterium]|nr:hypothetical protein [Lachnospiraceae bacterium]